jgi:hypothetical protein
VSERCLLQLRPPSPDSSRQTKSVNETARSLTSLSYSPWYIPEISFLPSFDETHSTYRSPVLSLSRAFYICPHRRLRPALSIKTGQLSKPATRPAAPLHHQKYAQSSFGYVCLTHVSSPLCISLLLIFGLFPVHTDLSTAPVCN